jgi:hypothetical protein
LGFSILYCAASNVSMNQVSTLPLTEKKGRWLCAHLWALGQGAGNGDPLLLAS